MRRIGRGFRKSGIVRTERAVNLIGGDVEETEALLLGGRESAIVGEGGLQQVIGAEDVGVDEVAGAIDGAIHMAFRGEVHYGIREVLGKESGERGGIAEVVLDKRVMRIFQIAVERREVSRVGEFVEVDHLVSGFIKDLPHKVGTNEASAAGDQDFHEMVVEMNRKPVRASSARMTVQSAFCGSALSRSRGLHRDRRLSGRACWVFPEFREF